MTHTFGSLFSGIGGLDLGLERAGWEVRWQVENDAFRQKILARHWPGVERRGDIATDTDGLERVDLICGGFPCQDVSVAGRRAGLAGVRSSLFFQFARLLGALRPTWCLIENVHGLLNSNDGRDFGVVLARLGGLGYWWSYRVLDSQHFGVPQRRRRVYIVGHLGGPCPPEILFEREGCGGPPPQSGDVGSEVAGTLGSSAGGGWGGGRSITSAGAFVVGPPLDTSGVREAAGVSGRLDTPDGPRYGALGDAVTVPVAAWIGARLLRAAEAGLMASEEGADAR